MEKKSYVVISAVLLLLTGCAAGNYGEEIVVEKSAPPMENPDQAAVWPKFAGLTLKFLLCRFPARLADGVALTGRLPFPLFRL